MKRLHFAKPNIKLIKLKLLGFIVHSFSLLAGHTCPYAKDCLSKAILNLLTGKRTIEDGPDTLFRCYSASQETQYTAVYNTRATNTEIMRSSKRPYDLFSILVENICTLPKNMNALRIHESGDFFSSDYLYAWIMVANHFPSIRFYGYTKALPFLLKYSQEVLETENLNITLSRGGMRDDLIPTLKQKGFYEAIVVFSVQEALEKNLPIDNDDSHALFGGEDFALLVHGTQPKR